MPKLIRVEFEETYVDIGKPLEITAQAHENVRLMDVIQVGDQLRYRYAIIWENGDADE